MAREGRSLIGTIWKNFIQSLRPRSFSGNLMGMDYFGNKFYEIPANPKIGKRRPSRWFEPVEKDNFQQEMPAEWEAWLRGRRNDPPLEEEIQKSLAVMQMKKINAAKLQQQKSDVPTLVIEKEKRGMESFPQYPEYDRIPGKPKDGQN